MAKTTKPSSSTTKKSPAKVQKKSPKTTKAKSTKDASKNRRKFLKLPRRRQKPVGTKKLSGSFRLFADSASLLRQHWKLFGGITLVYAVLSMLLVGGLGGNHDILELKDGVLKDTDQLSASLALFGLMLGSAGSTKSESGAVYQSVVILLVTLATIWSLRQVYAGQKVTVRDAFYKGMYPLVPFTLLVLLLCLELLPAIIGSYIFGSVFAGGLAVSLLEQVSWGLAVFLLIGLSLYLVCTSIFALYIVTLPDVRPRAAIRTARKLVRYKRWLVLRKLLFLPVALFVVGGVIVLPLIVLVPVLVPWVFGLLSLMALVFAHTYVYSLYKELL